MRNIPATSVLQGIVVLALASLALSAKSNKELPGCVDDEGKPVDWFIGYKFPYLPHESRPFNTGYAYAFFTSNDAQATGPDGELKWKFSPKKILSDADSLFMRTLSIAYGDKKTKLNTILYNDDPPLTAEEYERRKAYSRVPEELKKRKGSRVGAAAGKSSGKKAHAKGVVMIDDSNNNGFWLTHSFPLFPNETDKVLDMPENTKKYGQTFMCVSFDARVAGQQIVRHLVNMNPKVYESKISDKLAQLIPDLKFITTKVRKGLVRLPKLSQTFTSRAGQVFDLFSKSTEFDGDIYSQWLDKELKSPLFVETWRQGHGDPLNSYCPVDDYQTNNIVDLKFDGASNKITWTYNQDHSKWAISEEEGEGVLCIGDMNRMESQFKRGGGLVCVKCPSCWSVFSGTIAGIEPCPKKSKAKARRG